MINSILDAMGTTAVEMDLKKVKAYLQAKADARRQKQQKELTETGKKLKDLAHLWGKYNLDKVYLYGSITSGRIHRESDIDIAVEGPIGYEQLLRLYGEVDRRFSREVDIRRLEEIPFRESIKKNGVVIYEK